MTAYLEVEALFEEDDCGLSIVGDRHALELLGSALAATVDTDIELRPSDPDPGYGTAAAAIRVRIDSGHGASLRREQDDLVVSGQPEALALLGQSIAKFGRTPAFGNHIHIEHYPGHCFLRPDSIPLVVETA